MLIKSVDWNPLAIAGSRSLIAALFITVIMGRPRWKHSKTQWAAAIAYALTVLGFVLATRMTTAANAVLLQFTAPVYVALLGVWFLGERTTRVDWIFIVLVISGMVFFFLDQLSLQSLMGNWIGIFSGLAFGSFIVAMRKARNHDPLAAIWMGNILAGLCAIPAFFHSAPGAGSWTILLLLGVFQLGLPYYLYSKVVKHVTALDTVFILLIEPILNPLWVFMALGEAPGMWALVGGIWVLSAITLRGVLKTRAT